MTTRIAYERLLEVVDGDRELVTLLIEEGVLVASEEGFSAQDVDLVLCSFTLVRELNVNLAGVDIILRLRAELARARRRLAELDRQRRDSSET
ncbi:MAG TPA: hypothetical protein VML75_26865 [Kofleriaceae bacterium]|nr:hypothetical protein [Kofleriaceae bacterium]